MNEKNIELRRFFDAYNECFYQRDLEKLKTFYDIEDNTLIYFDNHEGNDTYTVSDHLELINDFFVNGKTTESGGVEPLIIENLSIFNRQEAACFCFIARYKSFPDPAVRSTLYLEKRAGGWKIIHAHCSFQPG